MRNTRTITPAIAKCEEEPVKMDDGRTVKFWTVTDSRGRKFCAPEREAAMRLYRDYYRMR